VELLDQTRVLRNSAVLRVPVHADGGGDDLDAFGLEDGVERADEPAVTVPDQVSDGDARRPGGQ
jgi:hypothetical protein